MDNNCKLKYHSSGSYGILIKNIANDFIYKLTVFSNFTYIYGNNFNEMIYLNYFKNKYPDLYLKSYNDLPIQNISTHIETLDNFINLHKIDEFLLNKITKTLNINSNELIIINKMKFYPYNLQELRKKDLDFNLANLYLSLEKIILGLHFFHSNGLAHGDLKPANILSDKINYKIADFGGIKYISNPTYECTCTSIYKSFEDYEHEYKIKKNNSYNDIKYLGCPIKSDIWSLGLTINELINRVNPIQIKYNQLKFCNNDITHMDIENKIYLYLKKTKKIDLLLNMPPHLYNINTSFIYKTNSLVEKMLNFNPNERIKLDEIYSNLYYQKLPDIEKDKTVFSYKIKSDEYLNKFINFRKYYYQLIRFNLEYIEEIFLYPYITNLLDRFLIIIINKYLCGLDKDINMIGKFYFIIELINYEVDDGLSYDKDCSKLVYNMNICYCSMYLISKLVILKKNINTVRNIINLTNFLNTKKENTILMNDIILVYKYIIMILNILNFDVIRTKLFIYKNTPDDVIYKLIGIIENFDIEKIIKYIE
jgi:serine/threonine protein kinase